MRFRRRVDRRLVADDAGYVPVPEQRLTADDAAFPRAVEILQRGPEPVIIYDRATLRNDNRAGKRDRRIARKLMSQSAGANGGDRQRLHTHYLQTLQDLCNHQNERERLITCAMIAAHDDQLTLAYRKRMQCTAEIAELNAELVNCAVEEFADEALSVSEVEFEQPRLRVGRRRREHAAAQKGLRDKLNASRFTERQLEAEIDRLHAARIAHWAALLVRVSFHCEYYNRRANAYLRELVRGLRRAHDPVSSTAILAPEWAEPHCIPALPPNPGGGNGSEMADSRETEDRR